MYAIETVDRFKTKQIAGRIIPAIATTTAAIAGFAAIELVKMAAQQPLENLKNCFLNLAVPLVVLAEPASAPKTQIREGLEFSCWDRWVVRGREEYTLADFVKHFQREYNLTVSMVCQGVKMIYMPIMPGHIKRLKQTMKKLVKPSSGSAYVDLIVAFASDGGEDEEEDLPAPPVRYFFG